MFRFFFFSLVFVQTTLAADSAPMVQLSGITIEGSAAEALQADPILSSKSSSIAPVSGTGSATHELANDLALPTTEGKAGANSTFLGLGRSSEDTDVQTLGIPLNGPQGGGFNFASFPQFFWSRYSYQIGPSLSAFDPRGISGTIQLMPWTASALDARSQEQARLTQFYSTADLYQASAGVRASNQAAFLAGVSSGATSGPAGSLSGRLGEHFKYHLLASRLQSKTPGSNSSPTPRAKLLSARVIPVLESQFKNSSDGVFKSTAFFDGTYLRGDTPEFSSYTRDQIRQYGIENAYLQGPWRLGASLRRTTYRQLIFEAPAENLGNLQVTRAFEAGAQSQWTIEPTLQGVWISRFGLNPAGSLGARCELLPLGGQESAAFFSRLSYSRRYGSLLDRFYDSTLFFTGNRELKPERDYTAVVGAEWIGKRWEGSLQAFGQFRQDAQVLGKLRGIPSIVNSGEAHLFSVMQSTTYRPFDVLDLRNALTLTQSRINATQMSIPYQPTFQDAVELNFHDPDREGRWELGGIARVASSAVAYSEVQRISGYLVVDSEARYLIFRSGDLIKVDLFARLEDVGNRRPEYVKDYSTEGRTFSMGMTGHF